MLTYRLVDKPAFTLKGVKRRFSTTSSRKAIPAFWQEVMGKKAELTGRFGLCIDLDSDRLDYWIADLYQPWEDLPADQGTLQLPAGLWAEFTCRGKLPDSIQNLATQIWSDWLPNQEDLELAGSYSLEVYDVSP